MHHAYPQPAARTALPERGFTLIELLVALFISAILFTIGYGSLRQALRSRTQLDEQNARLTAVQQALRTIEQDFELLQARPVRDLLGDRYLPALTTLPTQIALSGTVAGGPSQNTAIPIVSFTRAGWANPAGLQRSELQRVTYVLDNGSLLREYWPVLDATEADALVKRTLLEHVKSISLRFLDASHSNWQTAWPVAVPGEVPSAPPPPTGGSSAAAATAIAALTLDTTYRARPIAVEVTIELDDLGVIVREIEVPG